MDTCNTLEESFNALNLSIPTKLFYQSNVILFEIYSGMD